MSFLLYLKVLSKIVKHAIAEFTTAPTEVEAFVFFTQGIVVSQEFQASAQYGSPQSAPIDTCWEQRR